MMKKNFILDLVLLLLLVVLLVAYILPNNKIEYKEVQPETNNIETHFAEDSATYQPIILQIIPVEDPEGICEDSMMKAIEEGKCFWGEAEVKIVCFGDEDTTTSYIYIQKGQSPHTRIGVYNFYNITTPSGASFRGYKPEGF